VEEHDRFLSGYLYFCLLSQLITPPRHIFLQLCTGGDLFTYITSHEESEGRLCEGEAKYIMYQLLKALNYLHRKEISHRGAPYIIYLRTTDNIMPACANKTLRFRCSPNLRALYLPILSPKTSYYMLRGRTLMCS
jgi:serine/threonine protein kinase